jgi:PEP-CTERM motif-containing protein
MNVALGKAKLARMKMNKIIRITGVMFLMLFVHRPIFAEMVSFDFDDIQSQSKKGAKALDIELYMESLHGSDIFVSGNTVSGKSSGGASVTLLQSPSGALGINDGYLKIGKGKGSGISFDFGDNPIHSFSVDWLLKKGGKSFTILADGVVINQQTLSKAQKKTGASGHQDAYFFDTPIHKLEFIGLKKKSLAIDNLVINIPLPEENESVESFGLADPNAETTNENNDGPGGDGNPTGNYLALEFLDNPPGNDGDPVRTTAVPEPSSLLMLALGVSAAWLSRRLTIS